MTGIIHQSIVVKVAIVLTTIMFIFGLINSFLSFETFRGKATHNVGCGLYLFVPSIISIIVIILFKLKFWFLLLLQIGSIDNHLFSRVRCQFLDFFLRSLLSISDWLSACIAIERTMNVFKGVNIYDSIHRHIMFDKDEQLTWCVSQYSSSVQIYDWLLNIFHFTMPFIINCISALIIILSAARTRSNSQKTKSFKEHLCEQIHHHKHLLISPLILIVLAVPRLIISFLSGCMESAKDSWFYLVGYFVSFIPSMMIFVVFVLPSRVYKKEFQQSMKRFWRP